MSSHFNVGDKVRIAMNAMDTCDFGFFEDKRAYCGQVVTLDSKFSDTPYFKIKEDNGIYIWDESWFEPVCYSDSKMLTISFDPSNKTAAHRMVEEAIKNYYAPKDWTKEEVEQAKDLVCEMAMSLIRNNGEVFFRKGTYDDNIIHCAIYLNSFNSYPDRETKSCPYGNDVFNIWIGKCVALCKALKKPIPDFIRYKNT